MRGRGGVILSCQLPVEAFPLLFPEYQGGTDLYAEADPGPARQQLDLFRRGPKAGGAGDGRTMSGGILYY